jgi:hypothetical protein
MDIPEATITYITPNSEGHFDVLVKLAYGETEACGDLYDVTSCIQFSRMIVGTNNSRYCN